MTLYFQISTTIRYIYTLTYSSVQHSADITLTYIKETVCCVIFIDEIGCTFTGLVQNVTYLEILKERFFKEFANMYELHLSWGRGEGFSYLCFMY